jgi:hypothetical protein
LQEDRPVTTVTYRVMTGYQSRADHALIGESEYSHTFVLYSKRLPPTHTPKHTHPKHTHPGIMSAEGISPPTAEAQEKTSDAIEAGDDGASCVSQEQAADGSLPATWYTCQRLFHLEARAIFTQVSVPRRLGSLSCRVGTV